MPLEVISYEEPLPLEVESELELEELLEGILDKSFEIGISRSVGRRIKLNSDFGYSYSWDEGAPSAGIFQAKRQQTTRLSPSLDHHVAKELELPSDIIESVP